MVRTGSQSETAALMHITQPACGIGRLHGQALGAELQSEALYEEPVLGVVRCGHPLLESPSPSLADAAAYPWILPLPGMPMRVRLEAEFTAADTRLPAEQVESVSPTINDALLLASGMVSVMSHQLALHDEATGTLAILPLTMRQALGLVAGGRRRVAGGVESPGSA